MSSAVKAVPTMYSARLLRCMRRGAFNTAGARALFAAGALLAALVFPARTCRAQPADQELLLRVGAAASAASYSGRKMVINFSRLTPQVTKLSIVHQQGGRERRENHASRGIVFIDGEYFWQYFPENRLVVKRKLPSDGGWEALRRENLQQTHVSYEITSAPGDPVAGRSSRMYEFRPRQPHSRPLRRIWVDTETGIILRSEIYSPDNRLFWLSVFESLDFRHPPVRSPLHFSLPPGVRVVVSPEEPCLSAEEAEVAAGLPTMLPRYLPPGFVKKCIRAKRSHAYREIQVLYSDGLSLLSFFESSRFRSSLRPKGPAPQPVAVGAHRGDWYDLGLLRAVNWKPGDVHLTVLGEISRPELVRVAESVGGPRVELTRFPEHQ